MSALLIATAAVWAVALLWVLRPRRFQATLPPDPNARIEGPVAVVIPVTGHAPELGRTARRALEQPAVTRVVLVDAGADESGVAVPDDDRVEIVEAPARLGWSAAASALHTGLGKVREPYVLILDADVELVPYTLATLGAQLEADEHCVMASLLPAPAFGSPLARLIMPLVLFITRLRFPASLTKATHRLQVPTATGCVLVKTGMLRACGGFEPVRAHRYPVASLGRRLAFGGGRVWRGVSHGPRRVVPIAGVGELIDHLPDTGLLSVDRPTLHLAGVSLAIAIALVLPMVWLLPALPADVRLSGLVGHVLLSAAFATELHYYRQPLWRAPLAPVSALCLLVLTWYRALRR